MGRRMHTLLLVAAFAAWPAPVGAAAERTAALSAGIGAEIDAGERARYGLFPDVPDFQSAAFDSVKNGYRVTLTQLRAGEIRTRGRSVPRDAFEQTRWHVAFADEYGALGSLDSVRAAAGVSEAELLHRLALRYAARKEYGLARTLATDLRRDFPGDPSASWAAEALPRFDALAGPHRALIWPGSLLDQRGRTDLLVFSGYYGLWLGIAIPVALDAGDAQAFAVGLLATPAACLLLASRATRDASISRSQATLVSLGAHLGTFQGLGWAGLSDADGNAVVGTGVAAGLAGVLLAVPIAKGGGFTEGHAAVTNAGMYWGGWFGLVESSLTGRSDSNDDGPLFDMLVGSDLGVLGTAFGGGVTLLTKADGRFAMALLGAGSVGGLAMGSHWTRHYDQGKELAAAERGPAIEPMLAMRPAGRGRGAIPSAGLRIAF